MLLGYKILRKINIFREIFIWDFDILETVSFDDFVKYFFYISFFTNFFVF